MKKHRALTILCVLLTTPFASAFWPPPGDTQSTTTVFELTDDTFDAWRSHILPTPAETAWEKIGWLPSFTEGLIAAEREQRPLLLWVMNGHPLGCT